MQQQHTLHDIAQPSSPYEASDGLLNYDGKQWSYTGSSCVIAMENDVFHQHVLLFMQREGMISCEDPTVYQQYYSIAVMHCRRPQYWGTDQRVHTTKGR
jgi:hypothetical protein